MAGQAGQENNRRTDVVGLSPALKSCCVWRDRSNWSSWRRASQRTSLPLRWAIWPYLSPCPQLQGSTTRAYHHIISTSPPNRSTMKITHIRGPTSLC